MVDWDDLVAKIAGLEGGPRYFRIGLAMFVVGLICAIAVVALPIYSIEEGGVTYSANYGEMAAEPDADPMAVPNEAVLSHANLVIAASVLTIVMGLVLILEGRRLVDLRRFMVWHSEVRATALFALSAFIVFILLAGGSSLWSFADSLPSISGEGMTVEYSFNSPAAATVTILSGLMVMGLLFMVYYSTVLSVYRGGVTKRTRQMARFAMAVAVLALAALFALRISNIMVLHYEMAALEDFSYEVEMPFTQARIGYFADEIETADSMNSLDTSLSLLGWLLLFIGALCLLGCVGVAAHSLGGDSRRVRRTTILTSVAAPLGVVATALAAAGMVRTDDALVELFEFPTVDVTLGAGIVSGLVASLVLLVVSIAYIRVAGRDFILSAISGPAPEPELPQPQVDAALAAEGAEVPAVDAEAPLEVEAVPGERPPRRVPAAGVLAKRPVPLLVIIVAAIVVVAGIGYALMGGEDGGGGNGDRRTPVNIEELPGWAQEIQETLDMGEGQSVGFDVLGELPWTDLETSVYFISRVYVTVTWEDEADIGVIINRMENQPDTFMAEVYDEAGLDTVSDEASNPRNGQGQLQVVWETSGSWIMYGNASLVSTGNQDVRTDVGIDAFVEMVEAGDFQGLVRTQADNGNRCDITILVDGTYFTLQP